MGRKILFITTDQQRYDAYGCNGGTIARTPVTDGLAAEDVRYERAYCANAVCSPARSSMLTGRMGGKILDLLTIGEDSPSVVERGEVLAPGHHRHRASLGSRGC